MKFVWKRMKGVCLLLLGLATTGGGRSLAAEINAESFAKLAESSSATTAGKTEASPFKDESAGAAAKPIPVEPAISMRSQPYDAGIAACDRDNFAGAPGRVWFRGEYLNWWTSGAHLPPMVSTETIPGDQTTLSTLFGGRDIRDGSHEGYRIDLGAWLDCNHCWGLEADYFDLNGKPDGYDSGNTNGSVNGIPFPIVRAVYDPAFGGLSLNAIGYPATAGNFAIGNITVDTSDYFQSAGIWLRHQLRSSEWSTNGGVVNWMDPSARTFRLDAIGGYRFARLLDAVNEQDFTSDVTGTTYTFVNDYRTVNDFNGAELGLNAVYTFGRWSLDLVGKTAIGVNNQYASLYNVGRTDATNNGDGGGITNSGTGLQEFSRNRFSWLPQLTVTAGYQVTENLKLTAGYDLLYWSAVVRAADQIAVEPTTGYPYGSFIGTPLPAFTWNESHFLAQGIRLGAEVRF